MLYFNTWFLLLVYSCLVSKELSHSQGLRVYHTALVSSQTSGLTHVSPSKPSSTSTMLTVPLYTVLRYSASSCEQLHNSHMSPHGLQWTHLISVVHVYDQAKGSGVERFTRLETVHKCHLDKTGCHGTSCGIASSKTLTHL